eukprot:TRINITY_DN33218_c0_g1_i1.p3 TRINITY_DN33218_c0_g1~~TRINITY_DN33218_c0_g1_i1.p3  ORF type:complete len:176 (+),score=12.44 TRINITY_DN33218_c0_g1_i1:32-559(+)
MVPDDFIVHGFLIIKMTQTHQGCSKCDSLSYCVQWWNSYGVQICTKCKQQEQLISKTQAKQKYLLSDTELGQLGVISRDNPRHKEWTQMKLHLESQVRNLSYEKYGGQIGLEVHRRNQSQAKMKRIKQQQAMKRKRECEENARIDKTRKRIQDANTYLSQQAEEGLSNRDDAEDI